MFKTIRATLLFLFLSFALLPVVFLVVSNLYISKKSELEHIIHEIGELHILQLQEYKTIADFLSYETINPKFYETQNSSFQDIHKKNQNEVRLRLLKLVRNENISNFKMDTCFFSILDTQFKYSELFNSMVDIQLKRGFKDYGIEGQMRDVIHILMECNDLNLADVLMLRRHEKDYIIRNDLSYKVKLHNKVTEILIFIETNKNMNLKRKDELRSMFHTYLYLFELLVKYDEQLGTKTNTGIKGEIDSTTAKLECYFKNTIQHINGKIDSILRLYSIIIAGVLIILVAISILLSFWLSKKVTYRLSLLTEGIIRFVESNFEDHLDNIPGNTTNDEIGKLLNYYKVMKHKIIELIYDFKEKVNERTIEIEEKTRKIERQKEEIINHRDELLATNNFIANQKDVFEKQNQEIMESLKYAATMQQAMMPDEKQILQIFPESFIFYRPLGIVSGDFYWIYQAHFGKKTYKIFVAADCTGHGVPGALMSMLGISYLNDVIVHRNQLNPAIILNSLREYIIESRKRESPLSNYDGMDIAIGVIDTSNNKLHFAGANRGLIIIRDNSIIELKGDKQSVGKSVIAHCSFSEQNFDLQSNDMIYAFSDGYTDQFGGSQIKKFTKKRFKELLCDNSNELITNQKFIIAETFNKWKGNSPQIDDVLVMGIKWQ